MLVKVFVSQGEDDLPTAMLVLSASPDTAIPDEVLNVAWRYFVTVDIGDPLIGLPLAFADFVLKTDGYILTAPAAGYGAPARAISLQPAAVNRLSLTEALLHMCETTGQIAGATPIETLQLIKNELSNLDAYRAYDTPGVEDLQRRLEMVTAKLQGQIN